MDFDIPRRDGAFGIGEEPDPPVVLCDAARFARRAAPEQGAALVPFGDPRIERALGVLADDLLHCRQAVVIVRMEIDAEDAGQQDAVTQFQASSSILRVSSLMMV